MYLSVKGVFRPFVLSITVSALVFALGSQVANATPGDAQTTASEAGQIKPHQHVYRLRSTDCRDARKNINGGGK